MLLLTDKHDIQYNANYCTTTNIMLQYCQMAKTYHNRKIISEMYMKKLRTHDNGTKKQ